MTIRKENTMKTKFRRILAAVMAATTMAIGVGGVSASAAYIDDICLHKAYGAPSSDVVVKQTWNFTASSSVTKMELTTVNLATSDAYVFLYSNSGITAMMEDPGEVSSSGATVGRSVYASASLNNYSSGSHYAYGEIYG